MERVLDLAQRSGQQTKAFAPASRATKENFTAGQDKNSACFGVGSQMTRCPFVCVSLARCIAFSFLRARPWRKLLASNALR